MNQTTNNDVEILDPDVEVTIAGELVTVHEFSFLQGLKLSAQVRPLLDDLEKRLTDQAGLSLDLLADLFADHADLVTQLMAASCGKAVDWVSALNDADGQLLLMTFWQVNSGFFVNRLLIRRMAAVQADKPASPESSAGS